MTEHQPGAVVRLAADHAAAYPMTVIRRENSTTAEVAWHKDDGELCTRYLPDAALVEHACEPLGFGGAQP